MENCKGDILFVGEGDFSFSVAFARKFHGRRDAQITSTCLLSQQELYTTHSSAEENIRVIKDLGVRVLHEVDATKLEDFPDLKDLQFDYIIFNFPHTGGKSNIKNNRKLLQDFFPSAVQKLAVNGCILVSLARGQGGTPADQPVREWHDSWQVVAMAAYADLIMTDMKSFSPSDWMEYSSTGFRGMDRNFFTGGAFTYEFRCASTLHIGSSEYVEIPVECHIDEQKILVNPFIANKLNRNLLKVENHPINLMCCLVESQISNYFSKNKDEIRNLDYMKTKIVHMSNSFCDNHKYTASNEGRKPDENEVLENKILKEDTVGSNENSISSANKDRKTPTIEEIKSKRWEKISLFYPVILVNDDNRTKKVDSHYKDDTNRSDLVLRSTLLDCQEVFDALDKDKLILCYGDVYKRTWIEMDVLPVQHEFMVVLGASEDDRVTINDKVKNILQVILPETNVCLSKDSSSISECYNKYINITGCFEVGYKSENVFHTLACNQVGAKGPPSTKIGSNLKHAKLSKIVAYIGTLKTNMCLKSTEQNDFYVVIFNLDNMSQIKYDIPDQRLLWTENTKFVKQFVNHKESDGDFQLKPLSVHPPLWRHDLSFWEREDEEFNEQRFLDIIRNIAGDAIVDVMLMNVWRDPDSGQISKCYREVYQSQDSPISHQKAHSFQNAVRLTVEKMFRVQLR